MKQCSRCKQHKPITEFRKYYNANSHYNYCKSCEKIQNRYKYLKRKDNINTKERKEMSIIEKLWQQQGVNQTRQEDASVLDMVSDMMYEVPEGLPTDTPQELLYWLDKDLSEFHPLDLEEVANDLQKYRPRIGLDDNYNIVFDDTHREALQRVLRRFDKYEEEYDGSSES